MTARRDLRSSAQQLPVRSSEQLKVPFRKAEHDTETLSESERMAAEVLDAAFIESGLTTKEAAHLCNCSPSLIEKWRSTESRGAPSFAQLLLLPLSFHVALHRALNRKLGMSRAFLLDALESIGSLGMLAK